MIEQMVADSMLDMDLSADGWFEAVELGQQVHVEDVNDTFRFAQMLVDSLASERERYAEAVAAHDHQAADQSAAEQRDVAALLSICVSHLRHVGYVRGAL